MMWLGRDASFSAGQLRVSLSEDCKELGLEEQGVGRKLITHDKKQQSAHALPKTPTYTFMSAWMSATLKASTASQRG